MTREMILFNLLALGLGVILVAGLDGIATPQPAAPRSLVPTPESIFLEAPLLHPVPVGFERHNPFAPPWTAVPVPMPMSAPVMPENRGIPRAGHSPQGLPHPMPGRHLRACTPAEIPVALRGVMVRPGRAAEAQLTTQDGGQITVQVGSEIPVAVDSGGEGSCQTVKVVDISGGDVIVERDDRRVSLRTLLAKP